MKLLRWFLSKLECKDIGNGPGDVFFNRYTVLKCRWFSAYLHQFFRSDSDLCLHDHPWSFVSIVLRGGYFEEMRADQAHRDEHYRDRGTDGFEELELGPTALCWRRPGSILIRPARVAHRIVVEPGSRPWSMVIVGRKSRPWGFYTRDGWRPWSLGFTPVCEDGREVAQ